MMMIMPMIMKVLERGISKDIFVTLKHVYWALCQVHGILGMMIMIIIRKMILIMIIKMIIISLDPLPLSPSYSLMLTHTKYLDVSGRMLPGGG